MKILVTGVAGFIGFHCTLRLLEQGHQVIGFDNLNAYYDVRLKQARLDILNSRTNFDFEFGDLADHKAVSALFERGNFDLVLHLGAQAGVRYSIDNPFAYIDSNVTGTLSVLEACRRTDVRNMIYASSSSVYGANVEQPFSVKDRVDRPVSLYAATKRANELMCESYSRLYQLKLIGLRFFTVYGPWGRPDMAYFKFANLIRSGQPIAVYNHGKMGRDFTFIDDIVDGVCAAVYRISDPDTPAAHKVYNLGNSKPERLMDMISFLERALGEKAELRFLPMQPGDVYETFADISESTAELGYEPKVSLSDGLNRFAQWHAETYWPLFSK